MYFWLDVAILETCLRSDIIELLALEDTGHLSTDPACHHVSLLPGFPNFLNFHVSPRKEEFAL